MLKIRMQRTGRINMPSFRVVVTEHARGPKAGNIVEKVGTYNPRTKERNLDIERIKYWLSVGAQASPTMHNMLVSVGAVSGKKVNVLPRKSPPKKEEDAAAATAAATPVAATPAAAEEKAPEAAPDAGSATADAGSAAGGDGGGASA